MGKVTLGIGSLWQGGGERVCVNLANEICLKDHEVEIVVSSLENAYYLSELDSKIVVTEIGTRNLFKIFLFYLKYFKNSNNNKFIAFNYNLSFVVSLVSLFRELFLVSRSINTLTKEIAQDGCLKKLIKNFIIVRSLNMSDRVIAQSIGMKKDLVENGVNKMIIDVINNPVSPSFTLFREKKEQFILYAGRLAEQKNLFELIDILKLIDNNISLYIAGDGVLQKELVNYVADNGLSNRVVFLGLITDLKKYYASAICTVLTSKYEGFPNVLIESIACGTPVVSYDCPNGPSEIIIDGVNGYLIEFGDKDSFSQKVNSLIQSPLDPIGISKSAIKFNSNYITGQYLQLFSLN